MPGTVTCISELDPGVLLQRGRRNPGARDISPRSVDYILHPELSQNSAISLHLPFRKVKKITSSFKEGKKGKENMQQTLLCVFLT